MAKLAALLVAVLVALAVLLVLFPWDVLRGPLNRYVSERTGRHFEITRKLDVKLGRTTRILADGVVFANPQWARDPYLLRAQGAEVHVRLWPLVQGRIVLPRVELRQPELGLQMEADGRRTWALGRDTAQRKNAPEIGVLVVDRGSANLLMPHQGADLRTDFAIDTTAQPGAAGGGALPLQFKAAGTWQQQRFNAEGRTGNVLSLSDAMRQPFPADVRIQAGTTALHARGTLASLAPVDGADLRFDLRGRSLAELYQLTGVVLPESPEYAVQGHLVKQGDVWTASEVKGRLGRTDVAGQIALDRSREQPLLRGELRSQTLDFHDLGPLVGVRPASAEGRNSRVATTPASARGAALPRPQREQQRDRSRVLPTASLDVSRLKAMDADVRYSAQRIVNTPRLPLERMDTRVVLQRGVLNLEPLQMGFAGGELNGRLRIDGTAQPALTVVDLKARALELNKLFPGRELTRSSFGRINGDIDLRGRGRTVAEMLGTADGNVALLMGQGQISNLLLEFAGLDGGEIIKFLMGRDRNVQLRCAATSFDVRQGMMSARALVLDTVDTVVHGTGTINLATEALDLRFRPFPKDVSILSLRSPLTVTGTLGKPQGGLDKGALAGRAGLAVALGAINPLLGLAATIETGPGKDVDCDAVLRRAAQPGAAPPAAQVMGGPQDPRPQQPKQPPAAAPRQAPRGQDGPDYPLKAPG